MQPINKTMVSMSCLGGIIYCWTYFSQSNSATALQLFFLGLIIYTLYFRLRKAHIYAVLVVVLFLSLHLWTGISPFMYLTTGIIAITGGVFGYLDAPKRSRRRRTI